MRSDGCSPQTTLIAWHCDSIIKMKEQNLSNYTLADFPHPPSKSRFVSRLLFLSLTLTFSMHLR